MTIQADWQPGEIPGFTTIVAVDRAHAAELAITYPTWAKYKPEIIDAPLVLIVDARPETGFSFGQALIEFAYIKAKHRGSVRIIYWNWPFPSITDMPQRERMLSALVFGMGQIKNPNPYWLKIDTDTIATAGGKWIESLWFAECPALIASPWGYSLGEDTIRILDDWADTVVGLKDRPRLGYVGEPGSGRTRHPRIISYLCWVRTDFARHSVKLLRNGNYFGDAQRMPVPSQDTVHHYLAERLGEWVIRPRMKKHGWDHCKLGRLKEIAEGQT